MREKVVFFCALLLLSSSSHAQFRAGVKGGANLSNILMNINGVELETYESRVGIHGGLMVEYMFSRHFGMQSELLYSYCGSTIVPEKFKQWFDVGEGLTAEGFVNMHLFLVPVYLKTKLDLGRNVKLYLMGGGFTALAAAANQNIRLSNGSESLNLKWSLYESQVNIMGQKQDNAHLQRRWNAGLAAEVGIEIMDRLTIGGGFRQTLTNMAALRYRSSYSDIHSTTKMWMVTFSAGYFF